MNSKKLYVFLIGSLLSILLILTDSGFVPMEESSSAKTTISEVSAEKDKETKLLTTNFDIRLETKTLNSHRYLKTFTSYEHASKLFRPPISI